ncbi:MAG: ribulose-phosphate 3-epimerase [Candidatus Cloacimonetes bacterium]|nr:ribulose-phosphate 3-epimerase [Candidatus Cloacimonadota bacterium]
MKRILIAPSILSADFSALGNEISRLESAGADILHLDIMDGHYVPNLSFGQPMIKAVRGISGLPLDAHLMVTNPADYITDLAEIGVQWISFHPETDFHVHRLVHTIKQYGIKAGLVLNPATPINVIKPILSDLDYVLLMSVNPGFSGQSFIPSTIAKIRELRGIIDQNGYQALIQIDGGITDQNAADVINAGVDIIVSASYIFNSADYGVAIKGLRHV